MNELIESGNFICPPGIDVKDNDCIVSIPLSCKKPTLQIDIAPDADLLICEEIETKNSLVPIREEGHLVPQRYSGPFFESQVKWGNSLWNIYRISPTIVSPIYAKFLGAIYLGKKRVSLWMMPKKYKAEIAHAKLKDGEKYSSLV